MTWLEKRLWYVRSALHTLVMCRSKIIRRLTSKDLEPPAGTYTWYHRDLVREEALVCAFCFAYISDVPQQNNKKADFKATL
jgi:hypothetical protein